MHNYFNEIIYNELESSEFLFPTIEFAGYTEVQFKINLEGIYNNEQFAAAMRKFGPSVYHWHILTEHLKARESETFEAALQLEPEPFQKLRRQFRSKVNKLYNHPLLGDLLDSGEIDFAVTGSSMTSLDLGYHGNFREDQSGRAQCGRILCD